MTLSTYLSSVTHAEHLLRVAELTVDPYPDIAESLGHLFMATIKSSRDYPHCEKTLSNHAKFEAIQSQTGMTDQDRSLLYSLFSPEEIARVVNEARNSIGIAAKKKKGKKTK